MPLRERPATRWLTAERFTTDSQWKGVLAGDVFICSHVATNQTRDMPAALTCSWAGPFGPQQRLPGHQGSAAAPSSFWAVPSFPPCGIGPEEGHSGRCARGCAACGEGRGNHRTPTASWLSASRTAATGQESLMRGGSVWGGAPHTRRNRTESRNAEQGRRRHESCSGARGKNPVNPSCGDGASRLVRS